MYGKTGNMRSHRTAPLNMNMSIKLPVTMMELCRCTKGMAASNGEMGIRLR